MEGVVPPVSALYSRYLDLDKTGAVSVVTNFKTSFTWGRSKLGSTFYANKQMCAVKL